MRVIGYFAPIKDTYSNRFRYVKVQITETYGKFASLECIQRWSKRLVYLIPQLGYNPKICGHLSERGQNRKVGLGYRVRIAAA